MKRKTQLTVLVLALVMAGSLWATWTPPVAQVNLADIVVDVVGLGSHPTNAGLAAADAEANAMAALNRDYLVVEILGDGPANVFPGGDSCTFFETKWVCAHGVTARVLNKITIFTFP